MRKVCFKCNKEKSISEFYKHKEMKDGHLNKCKDCTKTDSRKHRLDNLENVRAYERKRGSLPHRVKARNEYQKTNRGREAGARAKSAYIERNPKRRSVHIMTGNAIRDGILVKAPCEVCKSQEVHAHHDDYDKPLSVRWLCPKHHSDWHKNNIPLNGGDHDFEISVTN